MKSKLLSLRGVLKPGLILGPVISAGFVLTATAQPTNCAPAPAGLVSWWRAEGNASDSVDSNSGALLNGASFAPGMAGQAFGFNGSDQCVQIPYAPSLVTSNFSVEAWVKPLAQVSDFIGQDLIFGQSFGHCQMVVRTGTAGLRVAFQFAIDYWTFPQTVSTTEIPIGQFSHLVGTWDGTALRLYINGVLNAQSTPGASPVDSGCPFWIGGTYSPAAGSCNYVGQFFNGLIDELSYFGRALTDAEIHSIYHAGSAGKCASGAAPAITMQPANQTVVAGSEATFTVIAAGTPPLACQWRFNGTNIVVATGTALTLSNVQPAQAGDYAVLVTNAFGAICSSNALLTVLPQPGCAPLPSGIVSWWRAEGNASDSADSNPGALLNGASFAPGMVGHAFSFNGSSQCVEIPYSPTLAASNYSVEAWIKPLAQVSDFINQDFIFGQSYGHCQLLVRTGTTGVRVAFAFGISHFTFFEVAGTTQLPIGKFSHVAGTWDGSTLRLYINGVLNAQKTPGASPVDSGCPFFIGGCYSPDAGSCSYVGQFFNGLIDELSYFNRALSSAEIRSIHDAGNAGKCSPNHIPVAICADAVVPAGPECQAAATVNNGSFDPDGDPITVSQVPPGPYPLGTNDVTLIVCDSHGASNACSALVIVQDQTPPLIVCPASMTVEFEDETGAVVPFVVTASDGCSPVSLVVTPPSGSRFPIGVTPVQATALDACTNASQCGFAVTVLGAQGVKSNVLAELIALWAGNTLDESFAVKFAYAIEHLKASLDPAYWVDQTHLQAKGGNKAMNEEKLAANKLAEMMDAKDCPVEALVLRGFIDRIVKCDRLLAMISIQDAAKAGLTAKKVAQDYALVAKGDRAAEAGHYANAIEHYRNAWRHALHLQLQICLNADGSTRLHFVDNGSKSYLIEVSTDLVNWVSLGTCAADADGEVDFTDPTATVQSARFYRVIEQ